MRRFLPLVIALVWAVPAEAHMGFAGLGHFANGALHPLLVPAHIMVIAASGLFAGRQGYGSVVDTAAAFCAGCLFGLIAVSASASIRDIPEARLQNFLLVAAMVLGAALALALTSPRLVRLGLVGTAAVVIGIDSSFGAERPWLVVQTYAGTLIASTAAVLYITGVSAAIHTSRPQWVRIGVRIAGSWIAAIAMLVLALQFAVPRPA